MPLDLPALLAPIAAALLPGWTVTCALRAPDAMPMLGALATCSPTPTRSIAHVDVVDPWPEGESLAETLWHELTHALLSPLTALIPASDGAIMVEEQAVERLGVLLSKLAPMARAAVLRGVDTYGGAPLRARISALAPRARGGTMDPKLITEALDALIAGDAAKCAEMLKGIIAGAAGAAPAATEPDGDEAAKLAGKEPVPPAPPGAPAAAPPPAAKMPGADDAAARKARLYLVDIERMHAGALPAAKATLVTSARARLALTPATEKRIMAAPTFAEAEAILAIVEEAGGGAQRARSGVEHDAAPDTTGGAFTGEPADKLIAEGLDAQWIARYQAIGKEQGAEAAALSLTRGREALQRKRARIAKEAAASKAVAS